jgi:hypothetical protein
MGGGRDFASQGKQVGAGARVCRVGTPNCSCRGIWVEPCLGDPEVGQTKGRPSFSVVCHAQAGLRRSTDDKKMIVRPTWFPAPIPRELGRLIFHTAWEMAGGIGSSGLIPARCRATDKKSRKCTKPHHAKARAGSAKCGLIDRYHWFYRYRRNSCPHAADRLALVHP